MEIMMHVLCLLMAGLCLTVTGLMGAILCSFLWKHPSHPLGGETPEEQEAGQIAAEAQRRYEQGFLNLMRYDGRPGREKEGENG